MLTSSSLASPSPFFLTGNDQQPSISLCFALLLPQDLHSVTFSTAFTPTALHASAFAHLARSREDLQPFTALFTLFSCQNHYMQSRPQWHYSGNLSYLSLFRSCWLSLWSARSKLCIFLPRLLVNARWWPWRVTDEVTNSSVLSQPKKGHLHSKINNT